MPTTAYRHGYTHLSLKQFETVLHHVQDKHILDLGCGDDNLGTVMLMQGGAQRVMAIDKEPLNKNFLHKDLTYRQDYFHTIDSKWTCGFDTGVIFWPPNYNLKGLISLIENLDTVLYLGDNTRGTMTGDKELWEHLTQRSVLSYVPNKQGTLIVYGKEPRTQNLFWEEKAALSQEQGISGYEGDNYGA